MSDLSKILRGNSVMTGADEFPASPNQAQLWLFQQLYPESTVYHIPAAIRIKGPVRVEVLQRCISTIFDRHDSFRTVFRVRHGVPVQRTRSDSAPRLRVEDLVGCSEDVISGRLIAEARQTFDLGGGFLWRAVLWRLNAEEHIFQLTAHHIVADGWSMGTIVRELVTLYEAEVTGARPGLSEVRARYCDFASRQIAASSDASHVQFWKNELAGIPPLVSMLFDRERPQLPRHHGDVVPVIVPQRSVDGLLSLGRAENTSLFTVLLTALKILIFRLTGQTDNVVGIMSANRRAETASLPRWSPENRPYVVTSKPANGANPPVVHDEEDGRRR